MLPEIFSRLTRTLSYYFRIGNFRLKDSSGNLHVRNEDDTAYVNVRAQAVEGLLVAVESAPSTYTIASGEHVIAGKVSVGAGNQIVGSGSIYLV